MACWNRFFGAVIAFWAILGSNHAFPDGAPESACESMLPVHIGARPQPVPSPYEVSVSTPSFQNGQLVDVQILGAAYQGLLLEARSFHSAAALGFWQAPPNNTRLLQEFDPDRFKVDSAFHPSKVGKNEGPDCWRQYVDSVNWSENALKHCGTCSGNPRGAITHSNTNLKMKQIYSWLPPFSHCPPVVTFVATIAQSHDIYWTQVKSKVIWRSPHATCGGEASGRHFSTAAGIACLLLMILLI